MFQIIKKYICLVVVYLGKKRRKSLSPYVCLVNNLVKSYQWFHYQGVQRGLMSVIASVFTPRCLNPKDATLSWQIFMFELPRSSPEPPSFSAFDQASLRCPSLVLSSISPYYFFCVLICAVAMETSLPAYSKWLRARADAFMTIPPFISLIKLGCYWKFMWGIVKWWSDSLRLELKGEKRVFILWFPDSFSSLQFIHESIVRARLLFPVARRWLTVAVVLVVR